MAEIPPWERPATATPQPTTAPQAAPAAKNPEDYRWKKGQSGNPAGRPKGIIDKRQRLQKAMMDDAEDIVRVVMDKALEGDMQAASLVLSRVAPALRLTAPIVEFDFDATAPLSKQIEQVLQAIADGNVTADVAKQIIESINQLAGVRAVSDLEARIKSLEENRR
jgi:hypothetical protein